MIYGLYLDAFQGDIFLLKNGNEKYPIINTRDGVLRFYTADEIRELLKTIPMSNVTTVSGVGKGAVSFTGVEMTSFLGRGRIYNRGYDVDSGDGIGTYSVIETKLVYNRKEICNIHLSSKQQILGVFVGDSCVFTLENADYRQELNSFFRIGDMYVFNLVIPEVKKNIDVSESSNYPVVRLFFTLDLELKYIWSNRGGSNSMPCDESVIARFNLAF